ncbi:MAG TPA: cysteine desulfurase-like protein [Candidatus Dormibacteraeota bacterium]|jgi:cysteine desulfurase family protein (TIGR01976 family)|nr:cysteine desulfurase-like protein [Candidatus Dormibacteraeota bacterium]
MASPTTIDLDLQSIRRQFPALSLKVDGEPVVYLDNPAGTQVPQRVIDRTAAYWRTMNANQGGTSKTSQRSDALIAQVREAAATFLNAASADEIVFGPNMTTLTFALSRAIGRELRPGDEIVVTRLDHDANVSPWLALQERGVTVRFVDMEVPECTLDMNDLHRQLTPRTRLVAITHASNAVGTIPDLAAVSQAAHAAGAWVWVDAVHYGPHGRIDVRAIDCDFLVCSSYKFYGPHQGVLYGRRELLQRLRPYKVRPSSDDVPTRWETGTQNHECLAGMLGAFEYLAELGGADRVVRPALEVAMDRIRSHERALAARLIDGLRQIPGIQIYGITAPEQLDRRAPTVSLIWPPHRPEAVARWLASHQVFVTHGDHYATELMTRLGLVEQGGTLRIGMAHYNTASEVDLVLELLAGFRG